MLSVVIVNSGIAPHGRGQRFESCRVRHTVTVTQRKYEENPIFSRLFPHLLPHRATFADSFIHRV